MQHILLFALLFSIVNGMLEECIWRGILLHYFSNQFGENGLLYSRVLALAYSITP